MTQVADFLADLSQMVVKGKPLAYATVVGYRSAIAAVHAGFPDGQSVSTHPVLQSLLKGIFNTRAAVRTLRPTWELPKVLQYLSKAPFEPLGRASLRDMSLKTAFLLQLASGRRSSWLHACKTGPSHLRAETGGFRILPALVLDKNQSPSFAPEPVFIRNLGEFSPDDKLHCPVRALKWYLDRTRPLRGKESFLFITTKEPFKRASKVTLSNWVKEAISGTYSHLSREDRQAMHIRAHDTRGVSASWAHLAGVSIPEILDAAAWSTPITFARFYLKDLPNIKGRFSQAVISTASSNSQS